MEWVSLTYKPQLPGVPPEYGPEPSIEQMVHFYYSRYFMSDPGDIQMMVDDYFKAILNPHRGQDGYR